MATYYIATTGNDTTGAGTVGNPWLTLAKFLASSTTGDTCSVAAGTYTWATATITNRTITGPTLAVGSNFPTAIFDGAAANVNWLFSGAVVLNNLILQNSAKTSGNSLLEDSAASSTLTTNNCVIRDSNVYYNSGGGVGGIMKVQNSGALQTHNRLLVYGVVGNASSSGTPCYLRKNSGTGFIFNNCTLFFNDSGVNRIQGFGDNISGGFTSKNTIIQNDGTSISWDIRTGSPTATWSYTNSIGITSKPTAGTGNISADSLFVDSASANFNLRPTSPCIDVGGL